jgi:hypothetical protein
MTLMKYKTSILQHCSWHTSIAAPRMQVALILQDRRGEGEHLPTMLICLNSCNFAYLIITNDVVEAYTKPAATSRAT